MYQQKEKSSKWLSKYILGEKKKLPKGVIAVEMIYRKLKLQSCQ